MIDITKIIVRSGKGGNGSFSFRREKYIAKGGPDGGDGGNGGSVILVADTQENTLESFAGIKRISAEDGMFGGGRQKSGKDGADTEISLPIGTVVWELLPETEEGEPFSYQGISYSRRQVAEILSPGDRIAIARGGRGGRGNVHFKGSVNRTPLEYELGAAAEEKILLFELKLLADIGFVGLPNAGKSTLLSVLTQARPKIANYPFTTLEPHLGVATLNFGRDKVTYVLADIPGLIEEASEGKGLGHNFLRHVERCRVLLYVLALTEEFSPDSETTDEEKATSLLTQYKQLAHELEVYNSDLASRENVIAINKIDQLSPEIQAAIKKVFAQEGKEVLFISALVREGLDELLQSLHEKMLTLPKLKTSEEVLPVYGADKWGERRNPEARFNKNKPTITQRTPLTK